METYNNPNQNNSQNQGGLSTNIILKICGALAVVFLMFLPVAGCEGYSNYNVNGYDIIFKAKELSVFLIFFIISVLCGVAILFFNKPIQFIIVSLSGLIAFLAAYFLAKSKDGMQMMEMKIGAYLAMLTYIAIAVISFIKNSTEKKPLYNQPFTQQPYQQQPQYNPQQQNPTQQYSQAQYNPQLQKPTPPLRPKFCTKCGNKFPENYQGKFCTQCGASIQLPKQ